MQRGMFRKNVRNVVQRILHELGDNLLCLFYGFGRPADRESSRGGSFRCSLHLHVCVGGLFDEGQVGVVLTNHSCKHRAWDGYLLRSEGRTVGEYTETTICRLILKICTGNTQTNVYTGVCTFAIEIHHLKFNPTKFLCCIVKYQDHEIEQTTCAYLFPTSFHPSSFFAFLGL